MTPTPAPTQTPSTPLQTAPRWLRVSLLLAGLYNLVWGGIAVLLPNLMWDVLGAARPNYPELWQCIGMIVGVYGIGYLIAARDPFRHWPIILVGFLGKIFGPIGFVQAVIKGTFPFSFGWINVTNDVIWWIPFGACLWLAYKHHRPRPTTP
jgi:MFS family permease